MQKVRAIIPKVIVVTTFFSIFGSPMCYSQHYFSTPDQLTDCACDMLSKWGWDVIKNPGKMIIRYPYNDVHPYYLPVDMKQRVEKHCGKPCHPSTFRGAYDAIHGLAAMALTIKKGDMLRGQWTVDLANSHMKKWKSVCPELVIPWPW